MSFLVSKEGEKMKKVFEKAEEIEGYWLVGITTRRGRFELDLGKSI